MGQCLCHFFLGRGFSLFLPCYWVNFLPAINQQRSREIAQNGMVLYVYDVEFLRCASHNLSSGEQDIQLKGRGQERPLDFSLKSNMAKTAPNFACQFVYTCRKLPCTNFLPFLLRIPEIKCAKTLACHGRPLLELLCYTMKENGLCFPIQWLLALFFFSFFFQMIT